MEAKTNMSNKNKIVSKAEYRESIKSDLRNAGRIVALCHGVFDLVHPGHIIHLEQAKAMADVLVVSITAAEYVRKGPGRPYFDDEMRLKTLAALECVDYVILSEGYTVDDIVECVEPDIYVKGEEYARPEDDITGKISEEKALVEKHGGCIRYTSGQTFSSTNLINTALSGLTDEVRCYMEDFITRYSMKEIRAFAEKAESFNVLVVGDIIIDKYTYCDVQGLMSKDMGYSARIQNSEEYLGGSVAIARHLSSFNNHVTLLSVMGDEQEFCAWMSQELSGSMQLNLLHSSQFPTIVKHRYLTRNAKREEYRKVLAVNNIPERMEYEKDVRETFLGKLREKLEVCDVVFLCDFGHGLIDAQTIELVQNKAKYLVLNCQTNSSNHGLNIITKYTRADVFVVDQQELKLAFPVYASDEKAGLRRLAEHLHGNGWLTRGALGAYGIDGSDIKECPAFTLTVKDTVGAGDAFFSAAGLYAAAGAPIEAGTFAGNIAGALAANIVGNKESVEKVNVLKYANTLMNV